MPRETLQTGLEGSAVMVISDKQSVTIYTDGSCHQHNTPSGRGGWAALLIYDNGYSIKLTGTVQETTSHAMEIEAVLQAIMHLDRPSNITFHTDAQSIRDLLGSGRAQAMFQAQCWRKGFPDVKKKGNIAYRQKWSHLMRIIQPHDYQVHWHHSASTNPNHVEADRLSKCASSTVTQ